MKNKNILKTLAIALPLVLSGVIFFLFLTFQKKKKRQKHLKPFLRLTSRQLKENLLPSKI